MAKDLPKVTALARKSKSPGPHISTQRPPGLTFSPPAPEALSMPHPASLSPAPQSPESLLTLGGLPGAVLPAGAPFRRIPTPRATPPATGSGDPEAAEPQVAGPEGGATRGDRDVLRAVAPALPPAVGPPSRKSQSVARSPPRRGRVRGPPGGPPPAEPQPGERVARLRDVPWARDPGAPHRPPPGRRSSRGGRGAGRPRARLSMKILALSLKKGVHMLQCLCGRSLRSSDSPSGEPTSPPWLPTAGALRPEGPRLPSARVCARVRVCVSVCSPQVTRAVAPHPKQSLRVRDAGSGRNRPAPTLPRASLLLVTCEGGLGLNGCSGSLRRSCWCIRPQRGL